MSEKHSCGLALHPAEHLAHRPHRPPHQEQLPLHAVDLLDGVLARVLEDAVLELLEAVAELLQDREGLVHDRVDQRVREEARVVAPQLRPRGPDALPDRVPDVAGGLLEGEHRPVPDEDADLLGVELAVAQLQLADDHEQAGLVGSRRPRRPAAWAAAARAARPRSPGGGGGTSRRTPGRPPRSSMPSTLIQRTTAHSGRCRPMNAGRSCDLLEDGLLGRVVDAGDAGRDAAGRGRRTARAARSRRPSRERPS